MLRAAGELRAGRATARGLLAGCLGRAEANGALCLVARAAAEAAAAASDARRARGAARGPLDGVPVAVKDNFCWAGQRTTAASPGLAEFAPPYSATLVRRLEAHGAVLVGKANMDEFGMGSFNLNSAFGPVEGLAAAGGGPRHAPGGSSGGSAMAVAQGAALAALGSDTGGSVRLPAAYCGLVGLKPSYGRLSRWGLIAYASSLDCPGVLAGDVRDAFALLSLLQGADPRDMTSLPANDRLAADHFGHHPRFSEGSRGGGGADGGKGRQGGRRRGGGGGDGAEPSLEGVTVGIPQEYRVEELTEPVLAAWRAAADRLEARGATVKAVSMPHSELALPAYYLLATAEAASNLARYDGLRYREGPPPGAAEGAGRERFLAEARAGAFGAEVQRRLALGTFAVAEERSARYHLKAQQIRTLVLRDFKRAFEEVDVLLAPTAASTPPTLEEAAGLSGVETYATDAMTVPASLAGVPAVSVPAAACPATGLPIGLQVIGPFAAEEKLFPVALALEPGQ